MNPTLKQIEAAGGPAFPVYTDSAVDYNYIYKGMTLRDYFAAKAMQALITRIPRGGTALVPDAYRIADAMLRERVK